MEKADRDLVLLISNTNPRLKKLYDEHLRLDKEIERYQHYAKYSSSAALHHRELKKAKLKGMDDIMAILSEHRHQGSSCTA